MKQLLVLFCICMSCFNLQAQNRRDTLFIYAGITSRTDQNVGLELDLQYIQKNDLSGGLRFSIYNYKALHGSVDVINNHGMRNNIYYDYTVRGFCVKPGWIPLKLLKPRILMSLGVYGVVSYNIHDFSLKYIDISGTNVVTDSRKSWNYGLETDWHFGVRFFKRFNIGASYIFGIRQKKVYVFEDVISGMSAFNKYSPAQGSSSGLIYVNFLLTFGFNF